MTYSVLFQYALGLIISLIRKRYCIFILNKGRGKRLPFLEHLLLEGKGEGRWQHRGGRAGRGGGGRGGRRGVQDRIDREARRGAASLECKSQLSFSIGWMDGFSSGYWC